MRGLKPLSIAATLMVAVSAVSANPVPDDLHDDEPEAKEDKKGGNAIDKTTAQPATRGQPTTGRGSLSPEAYRLLGDFWGLVLAGGPNEAWHHIVNTEPQSGSGPFSWLTPTDGPAESVLDQLDESGTPLPMVGEPGSEVTVAPEAPTPPPESILDFIDTAPAPQPAVGTGQDAAKPAVDQAPKPALAETTPQ